MKFLLVFFIPLTVWAQLDKPIRSMIPLPVMFGFDGQLMWGYHLSGGHHSHGGMNHGSSGMGDMDHGSNGMGDMDHGSNGMGDMDHGSSGMGDMDNGSNGMGDMDHDSNGMDDMDHDSEDMDHGSDSASHSSKNNWSHMVMPMISLGGDISKHYVNMEKSNVILVDKKSENYLLVERKSISGAFGAGLMSRASSFPSLLSLRLNLMPYRGRGVYKVESVSHKNIEANFKIPLSKDDLTNWSKKDELGYVSTGGVMFGAGAGFSIFVSALRTFMFEGEFITSIKKIDDSSVFVKIQRSKAKMYAFKTLNTLVELSKGEMDKSTDSFSFIFNLNDQKAQESYINFLAGNVLHAQDLSLYNENVISLNKSNAIMKMFTSVVNIGVPFLFNFSKSNTSMSMKTKAYNYFLDSNKNNYMFNLSKTIKTDGILSSHKNNKMTYTSMLTADENEVFVGLGTHIGWKIQKENASYKFISRNFNKAKRIFGYDLKSNLGVPPFKNNGFFSAQINLNVFAEDNLKIIKQNINLDELQNDVKKISALNCSTEKLISKCRKSFSKDIQIVFAGLKVQLPVLKNAFQKKNWKKVSEANTKIFKLISRNHLILKNIFKAYGINYKLNINIMGSRINMIETSYQE